jgi:formyltetrahydrofolate deformylase
VSPEEMVAIGREVEASVLSRAVRWHAEYRVFANGNKTVVLA